MVGVSNSDTNSPEGVMMMDGVSGRTELSSDKRESPEPFLSPGVNPSSQIFPSTQLILSQQGGKDYYSTVCEVVCHPQMFQTATQNQYHTTALTTNLIELGNTSHFNPFRVQNAHSGFASEHFFRAVLNNTMSASPQNFHVG
jgi:hypothetical protein